MLMSRRFVCNPCQFTNRKRNFIGIMLVLQMILILLLYPVKGVAAGVSCEVVIYDTTGAVGSSEFSYTAENGTTYRYFLLVKNIQNNVIAYSEVTVDPVSFQKLNSDVFYLTDDLSLYLWWTTGNNVGKSSGGTNCIQITSAEGVQTFELGKYRFDCSFSDYQYTITVKDKNQAISDLPNVDNLTVTMANYQYGSEPSVPYISGFNHPESAVPTFYYLTEDNTTGGTEWKEITAATLNAGTYYMYAVYPESTRYHGYTSATTMFTVTKADPTVNAPAAIDTLVYNGSPQILVNGGSATGGTVQYATSETAEDNAWTVELPTATNAGEYSVYYRVTGDSNYNDIVPVRINGCGINPRNIGQAEIILGDELTYNGEEQIQTVAGVKIGDLIVDTYSVEGNTGTDAGNDYTLTVIGTGNFTGTKSAKWSITKADMTVTAEGYSGIYDGSGHGISIAVTVPENSESRYGTEEGKYDIDLNPTFIHAGNYEVYYQITNGNYNTFTGSETVSIQKREVTVTSASDSREYNGTVLTNDVVTVSGDGFAQGEGATFTVTGSQTDCGSSSNRFMYVLSGGTSEDDYTIHRTEGILTVTKAMHNAVTVDIENWVYGTAVSTPTVTAQFGNPVITYAMKGTEEYSSTSPEDADKYVVRAVVAETDNYVGGSATKEFEIEKANPTVVLPTPIMGLVYTGTAQELVVSGTATGGTMEYTLGSAEQPEETFTTAVPTVTDAGTYHVWYRVIGDQNHNDSAPQCVQAIVGKKTLTITADNAEKAYDGTPLIRSSYSSEGLVENDQIVSVSVHGSQKLVGQSANVVENAEIKRDDQVVTGNYAIVYQYGTLIVTNRTNEEGPNQKYGITVEAENNMVTYDGNTHTVDGLKELDFTFNGVTYTVSGLWASATGKNAGEYISEVTGIAVVKDSDGNDLTDQFIISRKNGKLVINRRIITLTSASETKEYDGHALTNDTVTVGGDGFAAGEGATFAVTGSQKDCGSSANTFAYELIDGTSEENYSVSKLEGLLTVIKATQNIVTVDIENWTYGSAGSTPTVSTQFGNPVITYAMQGTEEYSSTSPEDAGKYVVRAVVVETENYVGGSAIKEFEIVKADLEITPPDPIQELVYNGTAQELITAGTTTGGTMEYTLGSAEQPEETFTTAIPTVTDAGTYHVWYRVIGDQNHNNSAPQCVQAIVGKKMLTITADSAEKAYDGTPLIRNSYSSEGIVGNDQIVSVSVHGSQKLVGQSVNVVENAEIKRDDQVVTGNYAIVYQYGTLIVTNRTNEEGPNQKYRITLEAQSNTVMYDGNTHTVDGLKELDFTFIGVTYTVSGLSASITGTNAGVYISEVKGTAVVQDSDGNDLTDQFIISRKNGKLVINRRNVTLTSASETKEYDGHALTNDTVTVSGDGFVPGEGMSWSVTGSQKIAGSSPNTIAYYLNENTLEQNYIITLDPGTLTVTDRIEKFLIILQAKSDEVKYDGKTHVINDQGTFTFTETGNIYTISGLRSSCSGKDAGKYDVSLTGTAVVTDADGNDVSNQFNVYPLKGTLTIQKRSVLLTTKDGTKAYDGTPLRSTEVEVGGDGFADDEGAIYSVTGSQKLPGETSNHFTFWLKDNTKADNYIITKSEGMLTVTDRTEEGPDQKYGITVEAESNTVMYDGHTHTVSGLKELEFSFNKIPYYVSGISASVTGEDAGEYLCEITGTAVVKDIEGNDLTNQFSISRKNGILVINKRNVTLTSADDTKEYDGRALTNNIVIIGGDGFAAG